MRWIIHTLGGIWELILLSFKTKFRFAGPYWTWRMETAFGTDVAKWPPRRQRLFATLEYARWVFRMKRSN